MRHLAPSVLAHQGGWDEALFVAVPMAVLVGLLWLAQRRAAAEESDDIGAGAARSVTEPDPEPDGR